MQLCPPPPGTRAIGQKTPHLEFGKRTKFAESPALRYPQGRTVLSPHPHRALLPHPEDPHPEAPPRTPVPSSAARLLSQWRPRRCAALRSGPQQDSPKVTGSGRCPPTPAAGRRPRARCWRERPGELVPWGPSGPQRPRNWTHLHFWGCTCGRESPKPRPPACPQGGPAPCRWGNLGGQALGVPGPCRAHSLPPAPPHPAPPHPTLRTKRSWTLVAETE